MQVSHNAPGQNLPLGVPAGAEAPAGQVQLGNNPQNVPGNPPPVRSSVIEPRANEVDGPALRFIMRAIQFPEQTGPDGVSRPISATPKYGETQLYLADYSHTVEELIPYKDETDGKMYYKAIVKRTIQLPNPTKNGPPASHKHTYAVDTVELKQTIDTRVLVPEPLTQKAEKLATQLALSKVAVHEHRMHEGLLYSEVRDQVMQEPQNMPCRIIYDQKTGAVVSIDTLYPKHPRFLTSWDSHITIPSPHQTIKCELHKKVAEKIKNFCALTKQLKTANETNNGLEAQSLKQRLQEELEKEPKMSLHSMQSLLEQNLEFDLEALSLGLHKITSMGFFTPNEGERALDKFFGAENRLRQLEEQLASGLADGSINNIEKVHYERAIREHKQGRDTAFEECVKILLSDTHDRVEETIGTLQTLVDLPPQPHEGAATLKLYNTHKNRIETLQKWKNKHMSDATYNKAKARYLEKAGAFFNQLFEARKVANEAEKAANLPPNAPPGANPNIILEEI